MICRTNILKIPIESSDYFMTSEEPNGGN